MAAKQEMKRTAPKTVSIPRDAGILRAIAMSGPQITDRAAALGLCVQQKADLAEALRTCEMEAEVAAAEEAKRD